tara:strand:+ start:353 stop:577 length:225 start_codon:yes stop_codon:yes gene_type:complete
MDTKETTKKLPDSFGDTVMEFAKLSTDAYRNGSLQGQLKMLQELQTHLQSKIDEIQKEYDQTEIGTIMKKVKDG